MQTLEQKLMRQDVCLNPAIMFSSLVANIEDFHISRQHSWQMHW
jgi:hypothetical protein